MSEEQEKGDKPETDGGELGGFSLALAHFSIRNLILYDWV